MWKQRFAFVVQADTLKSLWLSIFDIRSHVDLPLLENSVVSKWDINKPKRQLRGPIILDHRRSLRPCCPDPCGRTDGESAGARLGAREASAVLRVLLLLLAPVL